MHKKLTITLEEKVYEGLYTAVGRRKISQFINDLVRPYVVEQNLESAYQCMAEDEEREREALIWAEAMIGDMEYETRRSMVD